ncbi:MAG: efflux RND transporter permease subunit [Pirellulaceae bacterium]
MKAVLRWAIDNSPAMNTLMIAVLFVGGFSLYSLRREVFPEFDLEIILVTVPYPGASPEEVENGICLKIEEALRSLDGIKKQTSIAKEGSGSVVLELEPSVRNVQKLLNEVRSEVDRVKSDFPELAEDHEVKQVTMRYPAIQVAIQETNPPAERTLDDELRLRDVAEEVRSDLLALPAVSQATITGAKNYQIDIEISESTLREYGLTLQDVAQRVRRENIEMPGGSLKTESQEVLLRGKNKRDLGEDIRKIPLVNFDNSTTLTVGDLGRVVDGFEDRTAASFVNGRPGLVVSVERTTSEDLLLMAEEVRGYVKQKQIPGYRLEHFADQSVDVEDRMQMLIRNGLTGLVLVFVVLAIFLELRLAFWVAMGIPIAVLGAGAVLLLADQTLNMLSMFAFLMALGIVVDDAIVIGENIYRHREMGKPLEQAAIDGASEVLPSVFSSIATTIVAFIPLFLVAGVMGKFIAVMPLAVIAMLIISLIEATFVLPCHLAHHDNLFLRMVGVMLYPLKFLAILIAWLNRKAAGGLNWFIDNVYMGMLRWALGNPLAMVAGSLSVLAIAVASVAAGLVPFNIFPKLDAPRIEAKIVFADGTPGNVTDEATRRIEQAILEINQRHKAAGEEVVLVTFRSLGQASEPGMAGPSALIDGSHVGSVTVELTPTDRRSINSEQILREWRAAAGAFPGAESVKFAAQSFGPGGVPIEFKLLAPADKIETLEKAAARWKEKLAGFPGVFDVADDWRKGKYEYRLKTKPRAEALGVTLTDIAETVRSAYYGAEVQRLQRGRHEVKVMVRYPKEERRSLADFDDIHIRLGDDVERPLTELADVEVERGYSEINRINQMRSITVSADVDETVAVTRDIVETLRGDFEKEMREAFPNVHVRWEGQKEQQSESLSSLGFWFVVASLVMFALLTLEFRSYLQPLIIMYVIPFGAVGAIAGHALLGHQVTLFSMFGLVALAGVVVNDSIVLVDFINHRVRDGLALRPALLEAGQKRFRAVMLTSVTTVAGLMPMLLERSFQAQVLVPMAISLAFGLMASTVLVLMIVPVLYLLYGRLALRDVPLDAPPSPAPRPPQQDPFREDLEKPFEAEVYST